MLCTLTLAKGQGAKGHIRNRYEDPNRTMNNYQDYTAVILPAFAAADVKLDANAIVIATNTSQCLHTASHEWSPLRSKWIMESGLL